MRSNAVNPEEIKKSMQKGFMQFSNVFLKLNKTCHCTLTIKKLQRQLFVWETL